jgi:Fur family ferric uptake transcriptional regulator
VARYDIDTGHHAHLVCRGCHLIVDLPDMVPPAPPLPEEVRAGFSVDSHSLIFWGLCPQCRKKN